MIAFLQLHIKAFLLLFLVVIYFSDISNLLEARRMAEKDTDEEFTFPDTLEGFGYSFNKEGQLRGIETDESYQFVVREDEPHYNQKRYNALGDIITEKIYSLMETECKLQRRYIPSDAEENEPTSFVFVSEDLETNTDKLLILIHGSGAVRAGQWARRLIINDCLDSGTQLPYIKWAQNNGYAVIVANTNINTVHSTEKDVLPQKIRGNSSPEEHTQTVWKELAMPTKAQHVAIVAHSYGGVCTLELALKFTQSFQERVFAIALTDSVHSLRQQEASPEVVDLYKQRVVNWASAYDPLDTPLTTTHDEVPTVSAGTDRHDYTSYSSMKSIFKFLTERYQDTINPTRRKQNVAEPHIPSSGDGSDETQDSLPVRGQGEGEESTIETQSTRPSNQKAARADAGMKEESGNTVSSVRPDPQGSAERKSHVTSTIASGTTSKVDKSKNEL